MHSSFASMILYILRYDIHLLSINNIVLSYSHPSHDVGWISVLFYDLERKKSCLQEN